MGFLCGPTLGGRIKVNLNKASEKQSNFNTLCWPVSRQHYHTALHSLAVNSQLTVADIIITCKQCHSLVPVNGGDD